MANIDYSKYGAESNIDYSNYGLKENPTATEEIMQKINKPEMSYDENQPNLSAAQQLIGKAQQQAQKSNDSTDSSLEKAFKMAPFIAPTLAIPELSIGKGLLSKYLLNPAINALSRISAGTAATTAYQLPNVKNKEDLLNSLKQNAYQNAMLEVPGAITRAPGYFAEMYNPLNFAKQKASQIKNEFTAARSMTDKLYEPVNNLYNDFPITFIPKSYLKSANITRQKLYPDAKLVYDDFINEPNYRNLNRLQSKLGEDWARISKSPANTNRAQLFNQQRNNLKNKIQSFLSRDPNALNQYNLANNYARDHYYPYLATPTLRKIAKGKMNISPYTLSKSIEKGLEKTVGKEEKNVIPQGHALRNHLNDLNKFINFGKGAKATIPPLIGTALGEMIHPGLGGALTGAGTGIGSSAALLSHIGNPILEATAQNPLIQNIFKNVISPAYYGIGRGIIGDQELNK